jgi:hypothetical protein
VGLETATVGLMSLREIGKFASGLFGARVHRAQRTAIAFADIRQGNPITRTLPAPTGANLGAGTRPGRAA